MFDAYIEDLERKREMEGKKSKKEKGGAAPTDKKKKDVQGGSDDIVHSAAMSHAAKILERMANQNTFADVTEDFKFWEDQSDLYRDEGTLLPLWRCAPAAVPCGSAPPRSRALERRRALREGAESHPSPPERHA
jgi:dynein intermediate chain 1